MSVDAIRQENGFIVLQEYPFFKRDMAVNYHTSNYPVDSFQSDRKLFLGDNEYGSWRAPLELQNEHLSNFEATRGDNITALLHKMGSVKPGQSVEIITQLGQADSVEKALPSIQKYRKHAEVENALAELSKFWDTYLSAFHIESPDAAFNSMVNIHNPRQCHTTLNWSRYLSLYQLGLGTARGIGFRDSSQDSMGIMMSAAAEGKVMLQNLLSTQKADGYAMHQFKAITL